MDVREQAGMARPLEPARGPITFGPLTIDVATWVYGTVTLMSVLAVYEWAADMRYLGVVAVVIGPTIALALAHLFADVLKFEVDHARRPNGPERRHLALHSAQFLLVAVPPLLVLAVASVLPNRSVSGSVQSMIYLGVLSLGFWGFVAGRRSGTRGVRLIIPTLAGFLIGLVVIAFQLVLKPH